MALFGVVVDGIFADVVHGAVVAIIAGMVDFFGVVVEIDGVALDFVSVESAFVWRATDVAAVMAGIAKVLVSEVFLSDVLGAAIAVEGSIHDCGGLGGFAWQGVCGSSEDGFTAWRGIVYVVVFPIYDRHCGTCCGIDESG